ncbi:MAG: DUF3575 domain-containing protein [Prevotella sp.]|nr:DUF3575 domain-containing protein [Prevotella sp.]MCM1075697.1 DUF3575 domain-containing protein [Ruminococcus sp.]
MVALCALAVPTASKAQDAGLKTNLVGDALLSPNVAVEIGLAPRWTLDLSGELNFWKVNEHSWKHVVFQPEARYWFCERFAGHFLGVHALGGTFNVGNIDMDMTFLGTDFSKLKDRRYQGWGAGAGIAYGYAWPVHKHWNIEAEIGFGWVYTRFDSYPCAVCGTKLEDNKVHNYVGPTKAAVSVVYLF